MNPRIAMEFEKVILLTKIERSIQEFPVNQALLLADNPSRELSFVTLDLRKGRNRGDDKKKETIE